MSFLSAEQVRAVRLKGARDFVVDGLDMKLKIVKLSSDATIEAGEIQTDVTAGKKGNRDLMRFMLANGVANEKGDLLGDDNAKELLALIPIETLNGFMQDVKADVDAATKKGSANPS